MHPAVHPAADDLQKPLHLATGPKPNKDTVGEPTSNLQSQPFCVGISMVVCF